jgi:hypothetical protein
MGRTFIHGTIFQPARSICPCPGEVGTAAGRDTGGATLGRRNLHHGISLNFIESREFFNLVKLGAVLKGQCHEIFCFWFF